jgi:hypothetical protein
MTDEEFKNRQAMVEKGVLRGEGAIGVFRNAFPRRAFRQTSIFVDPPNGRQVLPTAEAEKRRAPRDTGTFGNGPFDTPEDFTLHERCITLGVWGSAIPFFDHNGVRIVQAPGMVAISYEMIHDTRVFYTDGRPHVANSIRQYLGDSRGRWDGDVLVVQTTNMTDRTSIGVQGSGIRHSARMTMTEQFRRVAPDILQYQITVDDPMTYPASFTASFPLTPLEGGTLLPYDCHEGNLTVLQALGAERAEDAALAADLAKGITRPRRPVREGSLGERGAPPGASSQPRSTPANPSR